MSIISGIEAEFQAIVSDARSVPEKLASLVGLHQKAEEITSLATTLTQIVSADGANVADKVEQILKAVGKL